jgi:hypothetical protein
MKRINIVLLIFTICNLSACINLDHIYTFASESESILQSQSDIGYSFYQSCLEFDCLAEPPTLDNKLKLPEKECNCDTFLMADKTILIFNKIISGYLGTMANLSDEKKVNYNYADLSKSIDAEAIRGKLNITSDQINAASKLATDITNKLLDAYRKKKLHEVITSVNEDFQKVMGAYIICIRDFLRDQIIENSQDRLKNNYSTYLKINNSLLSAEGKEKVLKEYLSKKSALEKSKKLATKYIESLQAIKAGHQTIFEEASHLDEQAVINMVLKSATNIKTLKEEFQNIKKIQPSN